MFKIFPAGVFICALITLNACVTTPADTSQAIKKSPNDTRVYRYLELDNQLKVFLVSDPGSGKSAAALSVYRGSNQDPAGREGLAHFLEHMLFIGTAKYPEVDGYQHFISGHGGSSNAYTAPDHTNYFFDIDSSHFEEGLDRFAQFFIAPLFTAEYVDREKNAVQSEYQLQIKDDSWRGQAVRKQVMNPAHPGARFSIGSLDTLAGDVRNDLLEFFADHYSAQDMALVVLGSQDLDTLQAWVQEMFSPITDQQPAAVAPLPDLINKKNLGHTLYFQTVKNINNITFTYLLPSVDTFSATKPTTYISNLLGHEGSGSLHSYLKGKGWIESLGGFGGRFDSSNATIAVSIELTASGTKNIAAISQALYDYIDLIRDGIETWRFEEQANVANTNFNFQEKSSATRFVYSTAPNLKLYTPQEILSAPYLMSKFDRALIGRYVQRLTPDNALIEISGPDVAGDKVEPWFSVNYRVEKTKFIRDKLPTTELSLPAINPFLPENLDIVINDDAAPVQITDNANLSVWTDVDTEFRTPRANTYYRIQVDKGHATPEQLVYAHIHARRTQERLNAYAYPAQLAGLGYHLSVHPAGFLITINGYTDKQTVLLNKILQTFSETPIASKPFERVKAELIRKWQNFALERPYSQTYAALTNLLQPSSWPASVLADAAKKASPEGLRAWQETNLKAVSVTALLRGNISTSTTKQTLDLVANTLPLGEVQILHPQVLTPAGAQRLEIEIDHSDASMVLYAQAKDSSLIERAYTTLATHLMKSPYFTSLRTNQQLGYVVAVTNAQMQHTAGVAFIVQSPVADPQHIETQTLAFLGEYQGQLKEMSVEDFESQRSGLLAKLTEEDKNLHGRSNRFWRDLDLGVTRFDSREKLAKAVTELDQASFVAYFDQLVESVATDRLVIYNRGQFHKTPETGALITIEEGLKARS